MKKKLYYSIGEIAEDLGIPTHNIRYWEKELPFLAPKNRVGGKRAYKKADFEKIQEVYELLHKRKFTIEGVRQYLKNKDSKNLFSFEENVINKKEDISFIKKEILGIIEFIKLF